MWSVSVCLLCLLLVMCSFIFVDANQLMGLVMTLHGRQAGYFLPEVCGIQLKLSIKNHYYEIVLPASNRGARGPIWVFEYEMVFPWLLAKLFSNVSRQTVMDYLATFTYICLCVCLLEYWARRHAVTIIITVFNYPSSFV